MLQRHRRVVPLGEVAHQRVDVLGGVEGRHARRPGRGVAGSASAAFPEGGTAEGARGACATTSAERTGGLIADAAVAAPAATTPVRNLRRSAFGSGSLRAMVFSSSWASPGEDSNPVRI